MFDFTDSDLKNKVSFLLNFYHSELRRLPTSVKRSEIDDFVRTNIKWTAELKALLARREKNSVSKSDYVAAIYRPFVEMNYCFNRKLTKRVFRIPNCQPTGTERNMYILLRIPTIADSNPIERGQ